MKLLEYCHEDAKMASNEFFRTIRRFITEFAAAAAQVEKEEMAKVRIRSSNVCSVQIPVYTHQLLF